MRPHVYYNEGIHPENQSAGAIYLCKDEREDGDDGHRRVRKLLTIAKVEGNKVADNMSALVNPKKGSMQMLNLAKK